MRTFKQYLSEMPWIEKKSGSREIFDLEFEKLSKHFDSIKDNDVKQKRLYKNKIKNYLSQIFNGKEFKDKYGTTIKITKVEELDDFYESMINSIWFGPDGSYSNPKNPYYIPLEQIYQEARIVLKNKSPKE